MTSQLPDGFHPGCYFKVPPEPFKDYLSACGCLTGPPHKQVTGKAAYICMHELSSSGEKCVWLLCVSKMAFVKSIHIIMVFIALRD